LTIPIKIFFKPDYNKVAEMDSNQLKIRHSFSISSIIFSDGRYNVDVQLYLAKGLSHRQVVEDSSLCDVAGADYLLMFRKIGKNQTPIQHPFGLLNYAGAREIPRELLQFRGYEGKQTENRFSHWIWRQYASAFWDDVRIDRVLPFIPAREENDERHIHPLQLDVIERCIILWSNPSEIVFTPFMGVGSEVYSAVANDRKAIGIELKSSYYRQAELNLATVTEVAQENLFSIAAA